MTSIRPCLWFATEAEQAARLYVSLLPGSRIDNVLRSGPEAPGGAPVMAVEFTLAGQRYMALNGAAGAAFTPAISLLVACADQEELDRIWDGLLAGGSAERCGWLRDRYGVSWQVVPARMGEWMSGGPERVGRVVAAMLGMTKLEMATLERAASGP